MKEATVSDNKLYTRVLVPLDFLVTTKTIKDRILMLYSVMGSRAAGKHGAAWVQVWDAEDICRIIGHVGDDGEPTKAQKASVSRIRRELVAHGRLKKVERRYENGMYAYGFAYVPLNALSADALALLNERERQPVTYCNPEDRLALLMADRLVKLPKVAALTFNKHHPNARWQNVLSALADFSTTDSWDFWIEKAKAALRNRRHPLARFDDMGERLQIGLASLEKVLRRNLTSNPRWKPESHIAWALSTLKNSVGKDKHATLSPQEERRVLHARAGASRWLRDLALETCQQLPDRVPEARSEHDSKEFELGLDHGSENEPEVAVESPPSGRLGRDAGALDALLDAYPARTKAAAFSGAPSNRNVDLRREMMVALREKDIPGLAGLVAAEELTFEIKQIIAGTSTVEESAERLAVMHGGGRDDD